MEDKLNQIAIDVDNYQQTIWGAVTFVAIIHHNIKGIAYSYGKKLLPSDGEECTPDIAIYFTGTQYALIADLKRSLTKDDKIALIKLKELVRKYCQKLSNWPGQDSEIEIDNHDVILILPYTRAVEQKRIEEFIRDGGVPEGYKLSFFTYNPQDDVSRSICIERRYGDITYEELSKIFPLNDPKCPSREDLLPKISTVKFLDHPPPVSWTCYLLWELKLPESLGPKKPKFITVNADDLTEELRQLYSFRDFENNPSSSPRTRWVRDALKLLARGGYAEKIKRNEYKIKFRQIKQPLEEFKQLEVKSQDVGIEVGLFDRE